MKRKTLLKSLFLLFALVAGSSIVRATVPDNPQWVATSLSSISDNATVVIISNSTAATNIALPSTTTSTNPTKIACGISTLNGISTITPPTGTTLQSLAWTLKKVTSGNTTSYKFYQEGSSTDRLYLTGTGSNTALRVGSSNSSNDQFVLGNLGKLLKVTTAERFVGPNDNNGTDWRTYNTENAANYKDAELTFYVLQTTSSYEITASVNGEAMGSASVDGTTINASPNSGYRVKSDDEGYTILSGTATVTHTGHSNSFAVSPESDCAIQVNFELTPTHTVTFSVNGTITTQDYAEGDAITFPNNPADIDGRTFVGWVTTEITGTTNEVPEFVTSATMGASDIIYYAVFATAEIGAPVETKAQTLQYDTWTYGGSTTNKSSYRLFHTGGYVESAAFDLSKLSKVIVYGGTFGGGSFNSLTIYDGTNIWKDVTVSGSNQTSPNEYTGGNNLTGTNKLYVRSNSGTATGSGVRISKIEIFVTEPSISYSGYCTTVVVAAVAAPIIIPDENPFLFSTNVTITCTTDGATIYYTTNGDEPNSSSAVYSQAFEITSTKTIKAIAIKGSDESSVTSVTVTKNLAVPTVTISATGITNTDVYSSTTAGSLSASVTYNDVAIDGATVTWSGNKDEVATIDASSGAVTLVATGSVTFTATYAGNEDFGEISASYVMTVTSSDPNGLGTRSNPYTVAQAKELMSGWSVDATSSADVYVSGIICSVDSYNSSYKSITYCISDDGGTTSKIKVYGGKGLGGDDFSSKDDLSVNDQVIVKGQLLKYSATVDEINTNSIQVFYSYMYGTNNEKIDCYRVIEGYGSNAGGYYLVASPVEMAPNHTVTSGTDEYAVGMITDDGTDPENYSYDLYSFDQSETLEWRNYRQETFNIVPGNGYLYANKDDVTINFWGEPTATSTTLTKDTDAAFEGMNLVGNPLGTKAYIDRDFYIMNSEGTELILSSRDYIFPMEGVFVYAESDEETLEFENEPTDVINPNITADITADNKLVDRAIVRFGNGGMLRKFQLNENSTKVFIPQDGKDYAIVRSNAEGEMPVNFKASANGTYTLSVNPENVEMNYLHLIDNMTGTDVDLLATPSYSFEAKTTDYASRFRLVFSANDENGASTGSATFAFFNGSEWMISNQGDATLQVIDMMGRVLSSETINGNANVNLNQTAGIYMLRLVNGNSVKVQKVVVR